MDRQVTLLNRRVMLTMVQSIRESGAAGREAATIPFPTLARDYYDPVYRFILRQSPSKEDAADITQEVFLRAQKAFPNYDPRRAFAPWIFTLARRQLADFYRHRQQPHDSLEIEPEDPGDNPREQADLSEQAEHVWKLAASLKPKMHQVLLLHYEEAFSIEEIARIMGLTRTHVKVLLFRARSALKTRLLTTTAPGGHPS
jgi:RNA polymerase sigma-70 factor (ECF subfamily)